MVVLKYSTLFIIVLGTCLAWFHAQHKAASKTPFQLLNIKNIYIIQS